MNEDTRLLATERVAAGAEFMDTIDPEWFWVVNPDTLNMSQGNPSVYDRPQECGCVLAQHHPEGKYLPWHYGLMDFNFADRDINTYDLGFISDRRDGITYTLLTELWREAINDRRADWLERHPRYLDPSRWLRNTCGTASGLALG